MGKSVKYASHTALSLLKLESEFHICKFDSIEKDPNEWISNLEGLQIWMNEFGIKGNIANKDFMIHILNNLPKEYDVILDGLENHLMVSGENVLTINVIHKKINHQYEKN